MPRFQIFPADAAVKPSEFDAVDASGVFGIVQRLVCKQADVHRNGGYSFSLRLEDTGLWSIYQRKSDKLGEAVPVDA